jgi:hypothetical protein
MHLSIIPPGPNTSAMVGEIAGMAGDLAEAVMRKSGFGLTHTLTQRRLQESSLSAQKNSLRRLQAKNKEASERPPASFHQESLVLLFADENDPVCLVDIEDLRAVCNCHR